MESDKHAPLWLVSLFIPVFAFASNGLDAEWFDDDFEARIANHNAGDLVFLAEPPP